MTTCHCEKPRCWKPVPGWEERYSISDHGEVKSHGGKRYRQGIMSTWADPKKYLSVRFYDFDKRKYFKFPVHRLVAWAFIGPNPESQPFINHKDGDPSNNHLENLEWCSPSENQQHRYHVLKRGAAKGKDHGLAKLTDDQVIQIRNLKRTTRITNAEIGAKFGCCGPLVSMIVNYKIWRHLP